MDASRCDVKERGPAVWNALLEEYIHCFNKSVQTLKHHRVLEQCLPIVLTIAHTTVIPILFPESLSVLSLLHQVECVVCMVFARHLRKTWFSLENERLDTLYAELVTIVASTHRIQVTPPVVAPRPHAAFGNGSLALARMPVARRLEAEAHCGGADADTGGCTDKLKIHQDCLCVSRKLDVDPFQKTV